MIAIILAAGSHNRMRNVMGDSPKALFPVTSRGDTLLSLLFAGLANLDFKDILVVTGDYYDTFSHYCNKRAPRNVKVVKANPDCVKGPLFTFLSALPVFAEDVSLILPGDIFIAPEGYKILKDLVGKSSPCLFTQPLQPFHHGPVEFEGHIIAQRNLASWQAGNAILPITQITPDFARFVLESSRRGATRLIETLQEWQNAGNELNFVPLPVFFWIDVDTPENLIALQQFLKQKKNTEH